MSAKKECGHYHFAPTGRGLTDPRRQRAIEIIEKSENLMAMANCPFGFGMEEEIETRLDSFDEQAYEARVS